MRLFVAVELGVGAIERVRALPRPSVPGVRWTAEPTWHVTLRFLGELPGAEPVQAALDGADLGSTLEARLGPRTRRLNPNVLVVPVTGVDDLAARVRAATAELGEPLGPKPFDAHLTIARRRRRGGRLPAGEPVDMAFPVDEVVLFSSTLSRDGPTHEVVHRWPLRREAAASGAGVPSDR
ncbi:MAG TPA: RNA 2',3'-cyclic phosphodiesterase [Acidimicrobiales bacterium]|nr:RNA 2',3'-cyclic phosphodiesterase [Acidimicrobiales bacterium]